MKFGIKAEGDKRNINLQVGLQKEEGEEDFFSKLPSFNFDGIEKVDDDIDLIDQIEDETDDD